MRIGLVHKRYSENGGSERQLKLLAEEFAKSGHSVDVFCRESQAEPPAGVRVHRMPPLPIGSLGEWLCFSPWARGAMKRLEQQEAPFDVTHAFGRTEGQDVYRLGGGCHPTYMAHAHALDRPPWLRRILRNSPLQRWKGRRERATLERTQQPRVITNSTMVFEDLCMRYRVAPERLHVVRNGVDLERFTLPTAQDRADRRRALGLTEGQRALLFLGSGYARKGLHASLRALALLKLDQPGTKLIVAGRDRRQGRWMQFASRLGVAGDVIWRGAVRSPWELYGAADCYVLPTTYDPAANSTLEALACGLPVVTTAMNGSSEILTDGEQGSVLLTPVDPNELAAACGHWLTNETGDDVAARCRALAEKYPARAAATAILDIYDLVRRERRDLEKA